MRIQSIFDRFATVWLLFWMTFIAVYIHFGGLAFAGLVILLGAVGWPVWILNRKTHHVLSRDSVLSVSVFGLFFIWLAMTGFWGGAGPETAIRLGLQTALAAALPALLLTRTAANKTVLSIILIGSALLGIVVLAIDVATDYGINLALSPLEPGGDIEKRLADAEMNIGRAHVCYAILAWLMIALFMTRFKKMVAIAAAIIFIALLIVGALMNGLLIVPIILILTAPFFWLGYRSPHFGLDLSLGALIASILLAPVIGIVSRLASESALSHLPMSWDHRVRMWDYCLTRIQEAPLLGLGLDSSRTMQDEFMTRIGVDWPIVSLHPHNIGLQTWMETGVIGASLLALAILSLRPLLRSLYSQNTWRSAALSGTIMATTVASAVTVGAWQYWWWGLVALALALTALIPSKSV